MEELKLYEGRPADCTGRLEKEIRTYDLLETGEVNGSGLNR